MGSPTLLGLTVLVLLVTGLLAWRAALGASARGCFLAGLLGFALCWAYLGSMDVTVHVRNDLGQRVTVQVCSTAVAEACAGPREQVTAGAVVDVPVPARTRVRLVLESPAGRSCLLFAGVTRDVEARVGAGRPCPG